MSFLDRISSAANRWVETTLAVMGISMAATVALQVFCRYVLNHSLFWSEELARILLIWLTFLGASSAYYRKVHPGIDIVTSRLSDKFKRLSSLLVNLLSLLFFLVMVYYGCTFAYFARMQISPALNIPKWIIYSAVPVGGLIFMLHCLAFLFADLLRDNRHDT